MIKQDIVAQLVDKVDADLGNDDCLWIACQEVYGSDNPDLETSYHEMGLFFQNELGYSHLQLGKRHPFE